MTPPPPVPFNDLSRYAAEIWRRSADARDAAVAAGRLMLGAGVDAFESGFSAYQGGGATVGVASGTDALELALRSVGVTRSSRVAVAANAAFYACTAVLSIGAEPVFVDTAPGLAAPGIDEVSAVLSSQRVDALVLTHLYGVVARDAAAIATLCSSAGVALVEDCSQSHGARSGGVMTGAFGDVAAFSLYPTKNLGALGDAGLVYTRSEEIAERVRRLRQYGWGTKYVVETAGGRNTRLDELLALALVESLLDLDRRNEIRRSIIDEYAIAAPHLRLLSRAGAREEWVGHLCVLAVEHRARVRESLAAAGVATDVHFPVPDHRQPIWGGGRTEALPNTEWLCDHVVSVPCFPDMTRDEIEQVAAALQSLDDG